MHTRKGKPPRGNAWEDLQSGMDKAVADLESAYNEAHSGIKQ